MPSIPDEFQLVEFAELTPERRAELEGDEEDPFDVEGVTLRFRAKAEHVALRAGDGSLVASTGIVIANVQVGDVRLQVVGLGGVIVRAELRGQGLARVIVEAAIAKGRNLGPPFALLFCRADRAGLYRRLGFREVVGEVLVGQPDGYQVMPMRTMWRALRPDAEWPSGLLIVHGLPF